MLVYQRVTNQPSPRFPQDKSAPRSVASACRRFTSFRSHGEASGDWVDLGLKNETKVLGNSLYIYIYTCDHQIFDSDIWHPIMFEFLSPTSSPFLFWNIENRYQTSSELLPLKNHWNFSNIDMGFSEMVENPASICLCFKKKGPRWGFLVPKKHPTIGNSQCEPSNLMGFLASSLFRHVQVAKNNRKYDQT